MEKMKEKIEKKKDFVDIISQGILQLKENEKRTISGRFGILGKKETLSSIGKELKLSRERIRQIENCGLKHLSVFLEKNYPNLVTQVLDGLKKSGGLINDEIFSEDLLNIAKNHKFAKNYLRVVLALSKDSKEIKKNKQLSAGWRLSGVSEKSITSLCDKVSKFLIDEKIPKTLEEIQKSSSDFSLVDKKFLKNCIDCSHKLSVAKNQMIGLTSWPSVNPRKVRDKIYYVLKTTGKPLHFSEISNRIAEIKFDNKKVVRATVHNELISDSRFVLIGRGIYALREWGYNDGTIYQVIRNILSNSKKPVQIGEIVALVNEVRKVKKNTIVINLQAKKEFKKVDGGYIYEKL